MAAKFGSILSDLSGDAGQILKVNSGGTSFEMATPPSLPSYTVTNDTADRVIDANDVTLDELADVVSTLIKDMATIYDGAGGLSAFQWSTSEQVWPFEKGLSGQTLYCKQVNLGAMPNNGYSYVAHGISSFSAAKVHSLTGLYYSDNMYGGSDKFLGPLPWASSNSPYEVQFYIYNNDIVVLNGADYSSTNGIARIIYWK